MSVKAKDKNIVREYRNSDADGRIRIMLRNYAVFPSEIHKAEIKIKYMIKAEKEHLRSANKDELLIRVQTSGLSDLTAEEALMNVSLDEAFKTGNAGGSLLRGLENAESYRADIRTINTMRMDYELLEGIVEGLEESDLNLIKQFIVDGRLLKDIACDECCTYEALKKRIDRIKLGIREDIIECLEFNCRKER